MQAYASRNFKFGKVENHPQTQSQFLDSIVTSESPERDAQVVKDIFKVLSKGEIFEVDT